MMREKFSQWFHRSRTEQHARWQTFPGTMGTVCAFAVAMTLAMPGCGQSNDDGAASGDRTTGQISADAQAVLASFPPIEVTPSPLDFGEVPLNRPTTKMVTLTNSSDKQLRVVESRSNCGCTTPDMSGAVIEPNSSKEVPIHFDAEGRVGDRSATVTIVFEDYERPIMFRISAHVLPG